MSGIVGMVIAAEDGREAHQKFIKKMQAVGIRATVIEVKEFTPKCLKECTLYRNEEGS